MRFFITPVFIIVFLFTIKFSFSQERSQQEIIDSLKQKSYDELKLLYNNNIYDTLNAFLYSSAYLEKAKNDKDTIHTANAYMQLGDISKFEIGMKYADSVLLITSNINTKSYPARGYILKSYLQYNAGDYINSFKNLIIVNNYALENNNSWQINYVKQSMAAIKNVIGQHASSLESHKKIYYLLEANKNKNSSTFFEYMDALHNVSSTYINLKKTDSAEYFINKGIVECIRYKDTLNYYRLISTSAYNEYFKGNYKAAIDSLDKAFPYNDDQNARINYYLYKGRIARDLNNTEEAISHFKKLDSIYEIHKDPIRALPEVYRTFIDYYKEKGDMGNQLIYLDKLIAADSVLDANFNFLNTNITKEYDIPQLVAEKDKLIEHLQNKKVQSNIGLVVLGLLLLLSGGLFFYYYRKQRTYKRRFGYLMQGARQRGKITDAKTKTENQGITGISEELIKKIIGGLNAFEQQNEFLDPSITLNSLSKKLYTNSNCLSKVINHYEQKNFSNYINDLRIDYAVEQLKTNKQFRLYSVKGIAEEVGFNSTESFSKAFFKRTGIHPSYFIKRLEKESI
ncbi:helix-turn-helix domain-containing protein [Leptobacterium flavescens]|uniref:Helix-turn-helix domain-containing protein n=1 Tax=Leptobacterium flavescens TaxID=472055 RepID=A0A6P0ULE3_9FLAO|nr:helix-turn-helix transcriptional regulator [Leptobacterium flavescens]NER12728.1 helix-turn-helix domain-containing protein [Leptobacterium flavescens]